MTPRKKRLRSGFTTGACAAAAARAAALLLINGQAPGRVRIPFPDHKEREFIVTDCRLTAGNPQTTRASIIKDAGDDPDVTNGAEIRAAVSLVNSTSAPAQLPGQPDLIFKNGEGVGVVTKPGLAISVGQPAINPVPRQMIAAALRDLPWPLHETAGKIMVEISIPNGRALAEKTLNYRLGIVGGLSILGSTGIVRPISAAAWTATIKASMAVARETGCREIVLSTGRTSEKAAQQLLALPVESYAMMGDYLEFSLLAARDFGFKKIHLSGMWAKILKAAMAIPQTHVRNGALEIKPAADFIALLAADEQLGRGLIDANTAREIYQRLRAAGHDSIIRQVCLKARDYAARTSGLPTSVYLVESPGKVVEHV
ncbi:MAG TPA: cobalamin biosynthesis protein CbiD [Desulfobacterales bacterium]|nr:cobalamin biosynthesis protein CbiD [Desulfobacterales bacterium]